MAGRPRELPAGEGGLGIGAAHHFARIYAAARAGCLAELRRAGCSEEEAEDIFGATLERIMRRRDPPREGFSPAQTVALLKRACRQKLIDERRRRDVVSIVPLADAGARADPAAESTAEAAEDREAAAIGREAISSLPERDRSLFLQRHRLGLSPAEILRRNPGLSMRTYRKVIQRANARALAAFEEIAGGVRCIEMRRERLRRYLAEGAGEAELREVRAHLRRCRVCRAEVARMRGLLHEVGSGFAALLAAEAKGGRLGELPVRLADIAGQGAEALTGATQAARERLRELAIRAASGLPGPGGEGAAGQIAGVTGAKAASVCAAGAITAGCLAAGVVPGVGGLEVAGQKRARHQPEPTRSVVSPPRPSPVEAPPSSGSSASQQNPRPTRPAGRADGNTQAVRSSSSEVRSARPTVSGQQTGTEFGVEAAGTGALAPTFPSGSTSASGMSPEDGAVSSLDATGSSGGKSKGEPEFGL